MTHPFETQITAALGDAATPDIAVARTGEGVLPSWFDTAGLAVESVAAAARELAALTGAREISLDRRLAQLWFDMTLRPDGWRIGQVWDPIAGDYRARDGWIRLHTNAPHHRAAALSVLGCEGERTAVAEAVSGWDADALEAAVVAAKGCAAAMRGLEAWANHPQGQTVMAEPLIAWSHTGQAPTAQRGLAGVKVLDLTRVLAGPVATRFLAGFGADVLRIDPPDWNEPGVEPEVTLGKRRAGLDLTKAEDRQVLESLMRQADILIHGYRPGAMEGLGYDAQALAKLNPGLLQVRHCAYGWTGPWAGRRGFDSLVQMSCGIADEGRVRGAHAKPFPLPVQALDHATGYLIAASALRALRLRQATGVVSTARLSLARTAALLVSGGVAPPQPAMPPLNGDDFANDVEMTGWGPAHRVQFPVRLDGRGPQWPHPAGPLRIDEARFSA